ncbi:hypothetical protein [Nannocystis pusilla]
MLRAACDKQQIRPDQLTIHPDRGAVPTSGELADLYEVSGADAERRSL